MAMASNALEIRSPEVSNMSISRCGWAGQTSPASSSSSSVVSPIAEATTTTSLPAFLVSTIRSATRRIRSADSTEEPPYFCTTSATRTHPSGVDRPTADPPYATCLLVSDDGNLGGCVPGSRVRPQPGLRDGDAAPDPGPGRGAARQPFRCAGQQVLVGGDGDQSGGVRLPGAGAGLWFPDPGADHHGPVIDFRAAAGGVGDGPPDHQDRGGLGAGPDRLCDGAGRLRPPDRG